MDAFDMIARSNQTEIALRHLNTIRVLIECDTKDWSPAVRKGVLTALNHIEAALAQPAAEQP